MKKNTRHVSLLTSVSFLRFALLAFAVIFIFVSCGCPSKKAARRLPETLTKSTPPKPTLPQPFPIPKSPSAAVHLASPLAVLADLKLYYPQAPDMAVVTERILQTQAPREIVQQLTPWIAQTKPWALIHLSNEEIVHLPVLQSQLSTATAMLAPYPKIGNFGAVTLPAPMTPLGSSEQQPPRLAWIDPQTSTITFASSLRGLVTGRELPQVFAKHAVWAEVSKEHLLRYDIDLPFERITAQGPRLHHLQIHASVAEQQQLPHLNQLSQGGLTGLLESAQATLGLTTRQSNYQKLTQSIVSDIQRSVNQAGFLGKMVLNDLAQQSITVIRSWNGRVFLGLGPEGHVLIGLGTDRPNQTYQQTLRLIRTLMENLSVGRMLIGNLPRISLHKVGKDPHTGYVVTLAQAQRLLGRQGAALLDNQGRLKFAFTFRERNGGMLAVLGPQAEQVLQTWSVAAATARPATESLNDLLALTTMLNAQQIEPFLISGQSETELLSQILQLKPTNPSLHVIVQAQQNSYKATIRGPSTKPRPPRKGRTDVAEQK